ncbi:Lrp/AsnC family transcriptional regulator [Intestinibaculum porci]|jgi:DNA-binding Lrp family transcriptional regulator|uniref:AsnC family transcriptional regulator n=1 Tax=Intestinibaculum porci TaxID=2487118 RepID=A0A3G9JHD5_9FIRM|nr:Lrp/AsnC family transcriptional regulator [Intestinibaculum porci]MDD6350240.1 Lrp/AsnC family transcriptional regulator [Intestinibaculum porci]MDD6422638.1 Lrp/AsnC family transcriptional regulator [Intestinibaculum porci]BBH25341.1 AsnC family transcriptional regulator [Intestinibaculum porci]HAN57712.1 AsnC family transcriptional regulator [Erysipelotrichaceae bacterium]
MEDKLLLSIMQKNARIKMRDLAAVLDEPRENVIDKVTELEDKKVICGYHTVINWDKTNTDIVTALIEIKATPEREFGYDRIASRIYKFEEVETMYLLAGRYDFALIIRGHTMQQVAHFVASKLAPISGVTETVTTFVLKNYKNSGIVMVEDEDGKNDRLVVTP